MKISYFLLLFLVGSCTAGAEMKPVKYDYLFHDGNSKVWMINKMIVNRANLSAPYNFKKELLIFYSDGIVHYLPMQDLGTESGNVGTYILHSDEKTMDIYFEESTWQFDLTDLTEDSIYMKSRKESDVKFSIQLVPLPKIMH